MASEHILAALDIGTTKIVTLIGEMDADGNIYVIGHGIAPTEGIRRGVVVDMEKTVKAINKSVKDAAMIAGVEVDSVTIGIAGEHIRSINSHGVVAVNRTDNEITIADVKKSVEAARTVAIPVDREIIHVIPQEYSVDDQSGIKDPIGMSGVRLEVQAHIVTASVTTAKNLYRALERCELAVDHMVMESLAASNSLLKESELEAGVILVDIGGDITNISIFYDGAIRHTAVVPLGGRNVTNDIAIGLRTPVEQAEALKLNYGAAMASMVDADEMIVVPGAVGRPSKEVSRNVLASIIEPRVEEILSLVIREIKKAGLGEVPAAGLVLTGGGALLSGTVELTEQLFDMPVRTGQISSIDSTPDELKNSRFATVHGLLIYGFNNEPVSGRGNRNIKGFLKKFENWITKKL